MTRATRRRRIGLTAQLDPDTKNETTELTTGANREKALRHRGGAVLAKKFETGAAPKGEARHTVKTPEDKRLRK